MKLIATLLLIPSIAFADISIERFSELSKIFTEYINPVGKKVSADYTRSVRLDLESSQAEMFGAYSSEPITVLGGTLKNERIKDDGLLLILCHEVAHDEVLADHYLGADVEYEFAHLKQDYFASMFCFKDMVMKYKSLQLIQLTEAEVNSIPTGTRTECETTYQSDLEVNICLRIVSASIGLANTLYFDMPHMYQHLRDNNIPPPSLERDYIGFLDNIQGRLITFVNGALGKAPFKN